MAGHNGVSLNWVGFDRAINNLAAQPALAKAALLDDVGEALVSGALGRFEAEESPEGEAWKPSRRAQESGGATLTNTARLRHSIDYVTTPDAVMVGSNAKYARIHQLGGTITPKKGKYLKFKGAGGKDVFVKEVTIPARPYIGVSKKDMEEVQSILAAFLASPFQS